MKVLGIMGSPRIKGNTDLLLDEALRGAKERGAEVEKIIVDKLNIGPCKEYYACLNDGQGHVPRLCVRAERTAELCV